MKIYYDQQIFMIQANGGISRYFFELIQRLGATGDVRATLFTGFHGSRLPLRSMRHAQVLGTHRFKVGPLWPLVTRGCDTVNRLLLRGLAPDIYHPTYYRPVRRSGKTRLVVTVYDMIHERFPHLFPDDETPALKRIACEAADAVICISEATRQDLLNDYPEFAAKTSVVHLAAAPEFTQPHLASPGTPEETLYALFVGSRRDYKGFDVALEAWRQIAAAWPELRLICVGGGAFNAVELTGIRRLGLEAQVSQRPASDSQLAELYRSATVLVYPSRYEGFGLPVLEAMACGCPVVCSRSSSLPEIGGEAAAYFEPGDAAGLASGVAEVLGQAGRRAALIQAGYQQQRRFSWDACACQTLGSYRRCLAAA